MSVYIEWPFLAALESIVVAHTAPDLMARILLMMERYRVTWDDICMGVFKNANISTARACAFDPEPESRPRHGPEPTLTA
jgi:hypothetical protein